MIRIEKVFFCTCKAIILIIRNIEKEKLFGERIVDFKSSCIFAL